MYCVSDQSNGKNGLQRFFMHLFVSDISIMENTEYIGILMAQKTANKRKISHSKFGANLPEHQHTASTKYTTAMNIRECVYHKYLEVSK